MLKKIREILKKDKNVLFAYLFGSYVLSPEYANDIDIAVYLKKLTKKYEIKLAMKIEKAIKKETEVIALNDKPLIVIAEVLRTGKLIYSRSEKDRVDFETRVLPEIFDFNELMKEFDEKRFERYGIGQK
jgi:predicted nucleotidyltransferase